MPPYYYYNTLNNKVSTSVPISMCGKNGPMSMCSAASIEDQHGCKYHEDATVRDCCLWYLEDFSGACGNPWAQAGIEKPKGD